MYLNLYNFYDLVQDFLHGKLYCLVVFFLLSIARSQFSIDLNIFNFTFVIVLLFHLLEGKH